MSLSGQRVVVTGGAGFLGRAVCERLRCAGAEALPVRSRDFDLRSLPAVRRLYSELRPHMVLHLAAVVGGIGANRDNPGRFFYENAIMGLHLIEAAREARLAKFVQIGTVCAYPKFTPVPFAETSLWEGYPEETNAPYGLAKRMLLVQLQAYRQQYGLNGIYLLPVNLYGPGDNFDLETSHVIPAMIRKFSQAAQAGADRVRLWGTGQASREFLYVDDCAEGIVAAAASYNRPEPLNLGTGQEIRISDLAATIARLCGFHGSIEWDSQRPDGQPRRCLDVSGAQAALGWTARTSLSEGLARTLAWWLQNTSHLPQETL